MCESRNSVLDLIRMFDQRASCATLECEEHPTEDEDQHLNTIKNQDSLFPKPPFVPTISVTESPNTITNRSSLESEGSSFRSRPPSTISNSSIYSGLDASEATSFNSLAPFKNSLEELLYNEDVYIDKLDTGITIYMNNFNQNGMPKELFGKKNHIFGNIKQIRDFHKKIFYPALCKCDCDIVKISNTFLDFIEKDYFYIYIMYAINHTKSREIYKQHIAYFNEIQSQSADKLGVNSFLLQSIQRIAKYKMLFKEIVDDLGKKPETIRLNKAELAACCPASKRIDQLLERMNHAMQITEIIACEIQPLHQGKFYFLDEFEIKEKSDGRRYRGKAFLFQKCVIYAETLNEKMSSYRGHYSHKSLGFTFDPEKSSSERREAQFKLYNEKMGIQEVEFKANDQIYQRWINKINEIMMDIHKPKTSYSSTNISQVSTEECNDHNKGYEMATIAESLDIPDSITDSKRYSTNTITKNKNKNEEPRPTSTWFVHDEFRSLERFRNSEKFYVQLLNNIITTHLNCLPDDVRDALSPFLDIINQILTYHADTFYPELQIGELDTVAICNLLQTAITSEFPVYFKYAALVHESQQMIQNAHSNSVYNENASNRNSYNDIGPLLMMPINRIESYATFLDNLLIEYTSRDLLADNVKTIANVEIAMKKLQKLVMDNYALNSIKGSTMYHGKKFGVITYSDEIAIDFTKCRIMILERGLVCVRTRLSSKTKKEKFIDALFSIPMLNIELHENDAYPHKMKIISDNTSHVNYTVTFSTIRKKKQFLDAILSQRNSKSASSNS